MALRKVVTYGDILNCMICQKISQVLNKTHTRGNTFILAYPLHDGNQLNLSNSHGKKILMPDLPKGLLFNTDNFKVQQKEKGNLARANNPPQRKLYRNPEELKDTANSNIKLLSSFSV